MTPHALQQEVLDCKTKNRLVVTGRRAGKTSLLLLDALEAMRKGESVCLMAPTYRMKRVLWRCLQDQVQYRPGPAEYRITDVFSGGQISVQSADVFTHPESDLERLFGSWDRINVDEAELVPDEAWSNYLNRALANPAQRVLLAGTFRGHQRYDISPFESLYLVAKQGLYVDLALFQWHAGHLGNSFLDQAITYAQEILRPEAFAREWKGQFVVSETVA
jgi:hypothetical protein